MVVGGSINFVVIAQVRVTPNVPETRKNRQFGVGQTEIASVQDRESHRHITGFKISILNDHLGMNEKAIRKTGVAFDYNLTPKAIV